MNLDYLVALQPDRMLHNFRVNAGLEPKAPVYGGWESEEPWVDIRCHGHTLGHYLTAVSLMFASSGDVRMKERVDYIVEELQACQKATPNGLVCAFPDGSEQLDNAVAGRPYVGVPWYTMHKIFAGLRDAHVLAESRAALEVLTGLADWTATATAAMTDEQFQKMLEREHGGMNEVLADVSALTGAGEVPAAGAPLQPSKRCSHRWPSRAIRSTDCMRTRRFPKSSASSASSNWPATSVTAPRRGSSGRRVVGRRSFVTGGNGDGEHFFPPSEFAQHLPSAKTMETCCTHNMLRLTRMLFQASPSAEPTRTTTSARCTTASCASQDPESGMMTYFQATRPGYVRSVPHAGRSRSGAAPGPGMENHAKYGDSIYFLGADAVWINLFIPSTITWTEKGLRLRSIDDVP